jgi:hypothetical protein
VFLLEEQFASGHSRGPERRRGGGLIDLMLICFIVSGLTLIGLVLRGDLTPSARGRPRWAGG